MSLSDSRRSALRNSRRSGLPGTDVQPWTATAITEPPFGRLRHPHQRLSDQGHADSKPFENKGEETKFPALMWGSHLFSPGASRRPAAPRGTAGESGGAVRRPG